MINRLGIVILPLLFSTACGGIQGNDYQDQRVHPTGPGLFSSDPDGFVIIDTDKKKREEQDAFKEFEQWKRSQGAGDGTDLQQWIGSGEPSEGPAPREGVAESEEFKEYKEYKEWKEYQEFLEWKRNQQGK